ncbi:hypothetical protein WQ57_01765 [Mesobacillus campisalis]|uniref:Uncharacterized protein n=1 Tax=Mesobacillus campisalis TaxID=1408103 RepID=A0A0M2SZM7_9BACI|nr:hypothetical protein WQ57_01765 [Mesobacillus campisalis]
MSKTSILTCTGLVFLVSQIVILKILAKINLKEVITLQTTFSNLTFSSIIAEWKANGSIDYYFLHYYFDFIHPIFYSLFLFAIISKVLYSKLHIEKYVSISYLPFVAGLFDIIENILHLHMITNSIYPKEIVIMSAFFTNLKWLLLISCLLVPILFLFPSKTKRLKE